MPNLKFALRTLFKTPFVTIVAIVSLALGIGANAAIFSLFNQLLMKPLPVPEPMRLVNLSAPGPKPGSQNCSQAGDCETVFSYLMFRDLEKVQTPFTGIAAHLSFGANLSARGQTQDAEGMLVSGSYFSVLGLNPAIGRLLTPDDDRAPGESHVVVLGYTYWQTRFGADPGVLGQPLIVNGQTMTIVGVAPKGFDGTTLGVKPKVYAPITMRGFSQPSKAFDNRRNYWAYLFARLKPGVSIEQARTAMATPYHSIVNDVEVPLQKGMSPQTLARFQAKPILIEPGSRGQSSVSREAKAPLTLLLGVTGVRAADRLREHREPAAGARRGTRRRDGDPAVDRRGTRTARAAAARRVVPAGDLRRHRRPGRRAVDAEPDGRAAAGAGGRDRDARRSIRSSCCSRRRWRSAPGCSSGCSRRCTARARI